MFRFRKKKPTVKELTAETERLHAETEKLIRQGEDPNKLTANPITEESVEQALFFFLFRYHMQRTRNRFALKAYSFMKGDDLIDHKNNIRTFGNCGFNNYDNE